MRAADMNMRLIYETPASYSAPERQAVVTQEVERPSKNWVREVITGVREGEHVRLRTADFVLLPDQQRRCVTVPNRWREEDRCMNVAPKTEAMFPCLYSPCRINWLAFTVDPALRSIRDLRARHLPMLERMQRLSLKAMVKEFGVDEDQIMVFANYPPSVYQLHFHFTMPFIQTSAYDAFRMHSLATIINNLRLYPDYYRDSTMRIPVHAASDLYAALCLEPACYSDDESTENLSEACI